MELHHLRYLVAVSEERHFGRAAEKLFISQPSLSYAIKALERELGIQLLHRSARRVDLTDAGRDVLAQARRVLRATDRVTTIAHQHRTGEDGTLRIGFESTGAGDLGTVARQRFTDRHPRLKVELTRFDWGGEADALRDDKVDVAFVWLPCDDRDLALEVVATEPRFVGLALDHPLATRGHVSINDLAGIPLMVTRQAPPEWVDWWAVNPRPDGSEVVWGPTNNSIEECFEHVADGAAAAICPTSVVAFYRRPDIAWVAVTDIEPLHVAVGWLEDNTAPIVRRFVETVREVASERDIIHRTDDVRTLDVAHDR